MKSVFKCILDKVVVRLGVLSVMAIPYTGAAESQSSESPLVEFLSDKTYTDQDITQIAFGSCNKPTRDQGFWDVIRAEKPDIMLLLGDNHYGNTSNPVRLKRAYDKLATIPQYSTFLQNVPTLPTWDNHDYGDKYPGRLHPHAEQSEQLFLDHFSIKKEDARRSRDGIYGSWTFGEKPHRVQVLMLDLQRFRDPFQEGTREEQFAPQPGKTLMGSEQWEWFEEQLKSEAEVRIIGSGIQVLSNEHGWRRWGMFPDDRERLLRVISEAKGTTVLLSGDRHRGEISVMNPTSERPLFDVTSSSFNVCYPGEEKNSLRVGEIIDEPHFGWLDINWDESSIKVQLLSSKTGAPLLTNTVKIHP
ncbi:alkaline phosphatase D family protein [Rubritalea sp.]|uniref:alkaline phosphatase D family protein n=1 Tax=Rubritalea sp. TaxID=2109375 RepID=UPI003EF4F263